MTPKRDSDGEDHRPRRAQDLPPARDEVRRQHDHRNTHDDRRDEREPEPAQDLRHLEPEVRLLHLLLRRAPRDVVREQVREQRLRQVDAQPAEEEETGLLCFSGRKGDGEGL